MPERSRKPVLGRLPLGLLLGCAVLLTALPVLGAESLPPSVRACSTITDSEERLACYDREVASFPAPAAKATVKSAPVAQQGAGGQAAASVGAAGGGTVAASSTPSAAASAGNQAAATNAQAGSSGTNSAAANTRSDATPAPAASDDAHISAHIVTLDRYPNEMILHLDNGQVWQQIQSVSGDLSLREGDGVKIDRHWGSYWLSGPHVSSMKVQRKS